MNHNLKSVWPATKGLIKNLPFMFICLASSTESLAIGGFSTFFAKFLETQFHYTSGNSSLLSGVIIIPGKKCLIIYLKKEFLTNFNPVLSTFNFFLTLIYSDHPFGANYFFISQTVNSLVSKSFKIEVTYVTISPFTFFFSSLLYY